MKRWTMYSGGKELRASFTIEATMVLGVVFLTIAALIRHAYIKYDQITGTMILEEMVIRKRGYSGNNQPELDFESLGEQMGNPRLWLGTYQIKMDENGRTIVGEASAGEWMQELEMNLFQPGAFLRKTESLKGLVGSGEDQDDRGS